jgi:hypothetical protein
MRAERRQFFPLRLWTTVVEDIGCDNRSGSGSNVARTYRATRDVTFGQIEKITTTFP